ncbi:MAG: DegT/DnrJ/EryC1/StrS family aminotransferase [Gammaproteobacteria bacterium]|nr:DegT/DnrJ/EryC1/StrS family aminotransferase [Gammaproteobacteria bacterium]
MDTGNIFLKLLTRKGRSRIFKYPFLKPELAYGDALDKYLGELERTHIYTNYGPLNQRFQQRLLSEHFQDTGHCVTVNNATSGLIAAISMLRRQRRKFALMPSFTFAATPLAAMWAGLEPFFVDVNPDTWNMCHQSLEDAIAILGDDVAVIVPYSAMGNPIDVDYYEQHIANGLPVVVDAASSFGTRQNGKQFGHGFTGTVVYSFHATKTFGIGEGGLVYSSNEDTIAQIKRFGNFGFNDQRLSQFMGMNTKLSEFHAAVGLATLDTFEQTILKRRETLAQYRSAMDHHHMLERQWCVPKSSAELCYQFIPMCAPPGVDNIAITQKMAQNSIEIKNYFSPSCHQLPTFEEFGRVPLPHTEQLSRRVISLPVWSNMPRQVVDEIMETLNNA